MITTLRVAHGVGDRSDRLAADIGGGERRVLGSAAPDANLIDVPDAAQRLHLPARLRPRADHRHDVGSRGREPARRNPACGAGSNVGQLAAVEQQRDGSARPRVEYEHEAVDRRRIDPREPARDLDRIGRLAVDVPGLHVDLPARLGDVQMDDARKLGRPCAVGDKGGLHRVDARGHRQRRTDILPPQHPDTCHGGSLPARGPPVNRRG